MYVNSPAGMEDDGRFDDAAFSDPPPMEDEPAEDDHVGFGYAGPSPEVLSGRIAAMVSQHGPGWQLPRMTVLARRFGARVPEVEAALTELAAQHVVVRQAAGRYRRPSPPDLVLAVGRRPGSCIRIETVTGVLACRNSSVSWHSLRNEVEHALRMPPGEQACVIRALWAIDELAVAACVTYVRRHQGPSFTSLFDRLLAEPPSPVLPLLTSVRAGGGAAGGGAAGRAGGPDLAAPCEPAAFSIDTAPPPTWAARSLRLSPGEMSGIVSVRIDDQLARTPVALAVVVLRPGLFRITTTSGAQPMAGSEPDSHQTPWQLAGIAHAGASAHVS